MARVIRDVKFTCETPPELYERTGLTRFRVRGAGSSKVRRVTVDREGLWTCSCPSSKYRGVCYHVNALQFELERVSVMKRLLEARIDPAIVDSHEFDYYYTREQFIAEPLYKGPRQFLLIARYLYLDLQKQTRWYHPSLLPLAGTVLEGAWDSYGSKSRRFKIFDCLYHKGLDYRFSPLGIRRDLAANAVAQLRRVSDEIEVARYEHSPEGKEALMAAYGTVILKDVNSLYDRRGKSPRGWMLRGRR